MDSAQQPFVITATYLLLVLKIVPDFMAKRQRFDLITPIRVYNVLQIIFNTYIFTMCLKLIPHFSIYWNPPDEPESATNLEISKLGDLYLWLKIFDLIETIFFILRKKTEQVTFLHVFHHVGLIWMSWVACKYFRGFYGFIPAWFNTFAHIFMYVYYLQSSQGKVVRNSLWKMCLTTLQIGHQLMIFAVFVLQLLNTKCPYSKLYFGLSLVYMVVVISLFLNFYRITYMNRKPSKDKST